MSVAVASTTQPKPDQGPSRSPEALGQGPGAFAWLAPVLTLAAGLFALAFTSAADLQWVLIAAALVLVPMLPTTAVLSLLRRPRPAFELYQFALAASMTRSFTSLGGLAAVVLMTDAPTQPLVWVFLLLAGVALVSEKLIVVRAARIAVARRED